MKRVLLIGDSLRMGYCEEVKRLLADRAEVIYPGENCCSTQFVWMRLLSWPNLCGTENISVVHFNCGQWDVSQFFDCGEPLTSLAEYEKNLRCIVKTLRKLFSNAVVIFATTTPMNPRYPESPHPRTTQDIIRYNDAAKRIMKEMNVGINDLFSVCEPWGEEYYIDYCHLTQKGYSILAERVAEFIKPYI